MTDPRDWPPLGPDSVLIGRAGSVTMTAVGPRARPRVRSHPEELALLAAMPDAGRADFLAGRRAAALCLDALGRNGPVLREPDGAPRFPSGVCGSLTHRDGIAVCVATTRGGAALGVDLEVAAFLPVASAPHVCTPAERAWVAAAGPFGAELLTMIFSAKEAAYKALRAVTDRPPRYVEIGLRPCRGGFVTAAHRGSGSWIPALRITPVWIGRYVLAWARPNGPERTDHAR